MEKQELQTGMMATRESEEEWEENDIQKSNLNKFQESTHKQRNVT